MRWAPLLRRKKVEGGSRRASRRFVLYFSQLQQKRHMTAAAHTLHRHSVGWRKGHRIALNHRFGPPANEKGRMTPALAARGISAL
ncbi:hypothetical protein FH063_003804 [Azospirillum argentinense]|uniref:Uncharacterized protein n=1 Tax=Azospirillum argentinense TaxID=2970906 RepID=A0A5B0KYB6_9PROT|nr:hypothetical protein FH063_003804 [Azospirillum argentinense]